MKANRKFIVRDDEAVSPVIAVILMVAITVVLAATVYVWVSGFGASGAQAKNLSLSQSTSGGVVTLTVISTSPNFDYSKLRITVDGSTQYGIYTNGVIARDAAWTTTATGTIGPGDTIRFAHRDTGSSIKLNFVDTSANTVVATLDVVAPQDSTAPVVSSWTCGATSTVTSSEPVYYVVSGALSTPAARTTVLTTAAGSGTAGAGGTLTWTHGSATQTITGWSTTPTTGSTIAFVNVVSDLAGTAAATTAVAC